MTLTHLDIGQMYLHPCVLSMQKMFILPKLKHKASNQQCCCCSFGVAQTTQQTEKIQLATSGRGRCYSELDRRNNQEHQDCIKLSSVAKNGVEKKTHNKKWSEVKISPVAVSQLHISRNTTDYNHLYFVIR